MQIITTAAAGALVLGVALTGALSAAPASAAPQTAAGSATVSATAPTTVDAPAIATLLLPGTIGQPVLVVGTARPGATVEVTYRGESTRVLAGATGTDLAGYWSAELPGRELRGGVRTISATQIVDGERSSSTSYEYAGFVFPF